MTESSGLPQADDGAGTLSGVLFDPLALERRFAPLDALGRALWLPALVHTESGFFERFPALAAWRERLLGGDARLVASEGWPDPAVAEAFNSILADPRVGMLTRGQPAAVEQLQRMALWHIDRISLLSPQLGRAGAVAACAQAFRADWAERGEELRQFLRLFESLDGVLNASRWSELSGLLRSQAWQDMLAARERMAGMPGLAALIARLGRQRPDEVMEPAPVALPSDDPSRPSWVREPRPSPLPGPPIEPEGIRRSGELAGLLASEWAQLRRRRRWLAARLADQSLLTLHHRQLATDPTWVRRPGRAATPSAQPRPRLRTGPMIVCIDTSASMAGAAEQVARAIVLEAARVAHSTRRRCLLYAWSGPGNLARREIGGEDGLFEIARFLGESFHGGTDVSDLFARVLDDLASAAWRQADLLIASDGEFGCTPALLGRLAAARDDSGLRIEGVLVGDRETIGMKRVCERILRVPDWRRHGRAIAPPAPIADAGLTARFFPGALQSAAPPPSGSAA